MASKKSSIKISTLILTCLMAACLIVGIVGLFLHFAVLSADGEIVKDASVKLFDLDTTAGVFAIIFAIVSVVGAAALLVVNIYTAITGKELKLVKLILTIVTIAASVAFLICAIVVNADFNEPYKNLSKLKVVFGAGPWMIFFGTFLVPAFSLANKFIK